MIRTPLLFALKLDFFSTFSRVFYYVKSYGQTEVKRHVSTSGSLHSNQPRERDSYWPISKLYLCKNWLVMFETGVVLVVDAIESEKICLPQCFVSHNVEENYFNSRLYRYWVIWGSIASKKNCYGVTNTWFFNVLYAPIMKNF